MAGRAAATPACGIAPVGEPGSGMFALTGTAGFATATALLAQGRTLFLPCASIDLDLAGVQSIDSAGLALLLCWLADARSQGKVLRLRNLPAQLRAIARISDVESMLPEVS